jgi:hypothetical protein
MTDENEEIQFPISIISGVNKHPLTVLTPEHISRLRELGYDLKKLYYSTQEEVESLRAQLDSYEKAQKLVKEREAAIEAIHQESLMVQKAELDTLTDLRDITADEVIRTNQWRNDEIVRRTNQGGGLGILGSLLLIYGLMMGGVGGMYFGLRTDATIDMDSGFMLACRTIFPLFNLIPRSPEIEAQAAAYKQFKGK